MMVPEKTCPGSRTIREPRPEYMACSRCGTEVEIWTDELKATCSKCGNKVYRAQQASCIDWCPHAKECVGPEVYERLRPGVEADLPSSNSPLAILEREHERTLEILDLLRGANLCLKLGILKPGTPVREKGIEHLTKVLDFFEKDLELHFRREEAVLFPALENHMGVEKGPTQLLIKEHRQIRGHYDHLKKRLVDIRSEGDGQAKLSVGEVENTSKTIEQFLQEHIRKENESLFPMAKGLLPKQELEDIPDKLRAISLQVLTKD